VRPRGEARKRHCFFIFFFFFGLVAMTDLPSKRDECAAGLSSSLAGVSRSLALAPLTDGNDATARDFPQYKNAK
jgi:hypothetical protein